MVNSGWKQFNIVHEWCNEKKDSQQQNTARDDVYRSFDPAVAENAGVKNLRTHKNSSGKIMSREREANTMGKNELQSFTIWFVLPNARSTAADPVKSAMMEQIIQWHVISISMLFSTNTKKYFFFCLSLPL